MNTHLRTQQPIIPNSRIISTSNHFFYYRKEKFNTIKLEYNQDGNLCNNETMCDPNEITYRVDQTLWPDHCVKNSDSAKVSKDIIVKDGSDIFIKKGFNCDVSTPFSINLTKLLKCLIAGSLKFLKSFDLGWLIIWHLDLINHLELEIKFRPEIF